MTERFRDKAEARHAVWDALQREGVARFPYPPHGRIPNVVGAHDAAERLLDAPPWSEARVLKVNPDAAQRPVREGALRRGIVVLVPTPRLKGGFHRLDPDRIPPEHVGQAASLSSMKRWAEAVPLDEVPEPDAIVTGSVAVTRDGRRCGKGEGYADLEYAILRELGHRPVPVGTTVHPLQLVDGDFGDPTDLPVAAVATPDELVRVDSPPPAPAGIDWSRLDETRIAEMPVLWSVREHTSGHGRC